MASRRETPFRYPKSIHARRHKPPNYIRYQPFKQWLRNEFAQKCVYCRRPDSVHPNDFKTYAVEHYWPKEHFPDKECDYANLFYACAACNSFKGEYWPHDETEPFFPNPCDHLMVEHVRFADYQVEPQSPQGAFMAETLHLNDEALVTWRKSHTWAIRALEKEVAQLTRLKKKLHKKLGRGRRSPADDATFADIDAMIEQHLATLDANCGTTLKGDDLPRARP